MFIIKTACVCMSLECNLMCVLDTLTAREQSFGSIKLVECPNSNSCRLKLKEKVCHKSHIQRNGF